ncbi:MAG TPA: GNAT family N-acetyltransferase [Actinomycetes bacterium]|nr:GNAT family N-acetyltransferase [Actinomycetes bacterium]
MTSKAHSVHYPSVAPTARIAQPEDVDAVTETIVDAFAEDPTWAWAFPDPALRPSQHAAVWRLVVEGAVRYPWVWLREGAAATAVWVPPGGTDMTPEQESHLDALLLRLPGTAGTRAKRTFEAFERAHPRDAPHFYLSLLATRPEQRGNGYGLGLLAANLRLVDGAGAPAYLEASNVANIRLYERYGFVVRDRFATPDDGPEVVTMWREPVPAS